MLASDVNNGIGHNRPTNDTLFAMRTDDLLRDGYSIQHSGMPVGMTQSLMDYQQDIDARQFIPVGIG